MCHRCTSQRKCQHMQLIQDNMDDEICMYLELEVKVPVYEQTIAVCVNKVKFPFFKDENYSSDIKDTCDCGYSWDVVRSDRVIPVFST